MVQKNVIEKLQVGVAGTSYRAQNNYDFNLSFQTGETSVALSNRKALFKMISSSLENGVFADQVHGDHIAIISSMERGCGAFSEYNSISSCDALVTAEKEIVLCIQTADCFPIFVLDSVNKVIALIHAGWRSTAKNIVSKTIKILSDTFQSDPKTLTLSFGPGIRSCCYKVSSQFQNRFSQKVFNQRGDDLYLDLIKENSYQSMQSGIPKQNILTESSLCTFCNKDLFYSYRREGEKSGRMISYFVIR